MSLDGLANLSVTLASYFLVSMALSPGPSILWIRQSNHRRSSPRLHISIASTQEGVTTTFSMVYSLASHCVIRSELQDLCYTFQRTPSSAKGIPTPTTIIFSRRRFWETDDTPYSSGQPQS